MLEVPYRRLPFPGPGDWIRVILARDGEEMMAWIPAQKGEVETGEFLRLRGENPEEVWAVAYISEETLSMTDTASSGLEN